MKKDDVHERYGKSIKHYLPPSFHCVMLALLSLGLLCHRYSCSISLRSNLTHLDVGPGAKPAQHRDTRGELGKF